MRPPGKPSFPRDPASHPAIGYRPPAYLRVIQAAVISALALAACAILYGTYWFLMANQLHDGAVAWAEAQRARGYHVAYSGLRVSGFPLRFRLRVGDPALGAPDADPPWVWRSRTAVVEMRPWRPNRAWFRVLGEHRADIGIADLPLAYDGPSGEIAGEVVLEGGKPVSAEVYLTDLVLKAVEMDWDVAVKHATLTARRNPVEPTDYRNPAVDVHVAATGVTVPEALDLPLRNKVARAVLTASLIGGIAIGDDPWPQPLAKWRDEGGIVDVAEIDVIYGPLTVRANGTMALDGNLQPIAAFTAKVEGFFETLDVMRELRLVRDRDVVVAKLVLGVMSKRPDGGGRSFVNLAATVQDRKVYAGPVALATLPAIDWGGDEPAP
jgi:hypothetical protein